MTDPGTAGAVPLNGTPVEIAYQGRRYRVGIQDVDGLVNPFRTPDHVARALLPAPWYELSRRLREAGQRALPLQHLAARAGAAPDEVREVERWLTVAGEGQPLNVTASPEGYLPLGSGGVRAHLRAGQTRRVRVWVGR